MLMQADARVAAFRPPPVEELSDEERRRLRSTLAGVVDSWRGAIEVGLHVAELRRQDEPPVGAEAADGGPWFRTGAAPVALGLTPAAAVSLLCVSLGARMPVEAETRLSEMDLRLLGAWAGRAVPELVAALGAGAPGEVLQRAECPRELGAKSGSVIVAELTFAAELPAGAIVLGAELARKRDAARRVTLGDDPTALLAASVTAEAVIATDGVPLSELLAIEVGDVLLLGDKGAVEAQVMAADAVVARARPGARAGLRALRVTGGVLNDHAGRPEDASDGF